MYLISYKMENKINQINRFKIKKIMINKNKFRREIIFLKKTKNRKKMKNLNMNRRRMIINKWLKRIKIIMLNKVKINKLYNKTQIRKKADQVHSILILVHNKI